MSKSEYFPHIDGLRSIAVLSVILFHFHFSFLSGGYIGVDVFFVISGYLITRLILNEVETTEGFRFSRFYARRIRRLFPALISTTIVCWIFAFLLLSESLFSDFAISSVYANFSFSNFFFWWSADFFDTISVSKPLLHTWSLSVEEQFYLVWPISILLLSKIAKGKYTFLFLLVLSLASLLAAHIIVSLDRSMAFNFYVFARRNSSIVISIFVLER